MAGLSYMQRRRSGIYEFRRRLPQEIAGKAAPVQLPPHLQELINEARHSFKHELTISLGTSDSKLAKTRDMRQAVRVQTLFEDALQFFRNGSEASKSTPGLLPSPGEIEAHFVRELLAEDDRERNQGDARRYHQTPDERAQWPLLEPVAFGELGAYEAALRGTGGKLPAAAT